MTKEQWTKIISIIVSALLAIAAVFGWFLPVELPEERAIRERIAFDTREDSYFYNGADLYFYSDDHTTQKLHIDGATGNIDAEGTLDVAGTATFSGLSLLSSTSITVTGGMTLTPTANVYRLNAAGAVTITLAACTNDGQVLYLYGEDNQTITVADSNILTHDGAAWSIGQYDLVAAICIDTKWVQVAELANS